MKKIFGYSYCREDEYGIGCGIVIADNKEKVIEIIASCNYKSDFSIEDLNYVEDTYTIKEIPFNEGEYSIGSYFE